MSHRERIEQHKKHYAKISDKLKKHNPEIAKGNREEREKSYKNLEEYIFIKVKKQKVIER